MLGASFGPTGEELPSSPRVVSTRIIAGDRTEELLGTERRKIDNSQSGSSSVRKLRVRRTWIRKSEVITEKTVKVGGTAGFTIPQIADLKGSIEGTLRKQRTESEQEERSFEEEVEVAVPARSAVEVLVHWKMVWDHSTVVIELDDGTTYSIPVRETAGVTFDQENRDLN